MKKKFLTTLIIVLIGAIVLGSYYWIRTYLTPTSNGGTITFQLLNEKQEIKINETFMFEENETLYEVLIEHYEVTMHPTISGVLLGVDSYQTDFTSTFFGIYVNDSFATSGIKDLVLQDKDKVTLKITSVGGAFA